MKDEKEGIAGCWARLPVPSEQLHIPLIQLGEQLLFIETDVFIVEFVFSESSRKSGHVFLMELKLQ
jgi:hypothetical protein